MWTLPNFAWIARALTRCQCSKSCGRQLSEREGNVDIVIRITIAKPGLAGMSISVVIHMIHQSCACRHADTATRQTPANQAPCESENHRKRSSVAEDKANFIDLPHLPFSRRLWIFKDVRPYVMHILAAILQLWPKESNRRDDIPAASESMSNCRRCPANVGSFCRSTISLQPL